MNGWFLIFGLLGNTYSLNKLNIYLKPRLQIHRYEPIVFMHWPLAQRPGKILHSSMSSPCDPNPDSRQSSSKSKVPLVGQISQSYSETPHPSPIVQQQSDRVTYRAIHEVMLSWLEILRGKSKIILEFEDTFKKEILQAIVVMMFSDFHRFHLHFLRHQKHLIV